MFQSNADVVLRMLGAIEGGYIKEAGSLLSDDFMFSGPTPRPIDKQKFLELHQALINAIVDWSYNISDVQEKDGVVRLAVRITGTNTGDINIPLVGLMHVKATGKRISLPQERMTFAVRDGRITRLDAEQVPNGGLSGILGQLGLEIPALASV